MRINEITCISDIYYVIGRWFTIAMIIIGFVALPMTLERYESVLSLLMCGGIIFVGVAAEYRNKVDYPIHAYSALIAAICAVIWVANIEPLNLLVLLIALIGIVDKKRWLLWCELPCFLMVAVSLIL